MTHSPQSLPAPFPPGPTARWPGQLLLQFHRTPLEFLTRLARHYGDIVHFRSGRLDYFLLNHPDHIHDILVTHADQFTKGPALHRAELTLGQGLLTSEGDLHKRQRKLMQPVFHAQRVSAYAFAMVEHARRLRDHWHPGLILDIHEHMMQLALRIVADALFGTDIEPQVKQIGQAMTASVKMFTRALMPWGPLIALLPLPANLRYWHARRYLHQTIDQMIRHRHLMENTLESPPRPDLLSRLLHARDDGTGMTDTQLRDEAITIFTAGHETTANALTFAWYLLAANPNAREALEAELDTVLANRLPTADDIPRLRYTRAVLAESMRLYPPAWTVGRRAIAPVTVGGCQLPPGSVVLMSQWVVHHDPRYWPNPECFIPDRWLTDAAPRPKYAYFPFGGGPRQCIGEPFAWLEATLVLATLSQRWRLNRLDDHPLPLEPTITLRPRDPLRMLITPR
ncbi:MAG: cytochrome P450 [Bacillota bacterium]